MTVWKRIICYDINITLNAQNKAKRHVTEYEKYVEYIQWKKKKSQAKTGKDSHWKHRKKKNTFERWQQ